MRKEQHKLSALKEKKINLYGGKIRGRSEKMCGKYLYATLS